MTASEIARQLFRSTLDLCRGDRLTANVASALMSQDDGVDAYWLCGAGKASPAMAAGLVDRIGSRLAGGLIVTKVGHGWPGLPVETIYGGHPIPDERSLIAGARMAAMRFGPRDRVLFMLSGGASALMESLLDGTTLADLQVDTARMLASGKPIDEVNAWRRSVSVLKGGGLGRMWSEADVRVAVLSDVLGDDLATIGSGPFFSRKGEVAKPTHPHVLCASRSLLVDTAAKIAVGPVQVLSEVDGEAAAVGVEFARRTLAFNGTTLAGGEPVVHLRGAGVGGRAQEAALAAAEVLKGHPDVAVLIAGSDGTDGPTDAAGACVDGATWRDGAREALLNNDSYTFHRAAGTLVETGPTGTNLGDLLIGVNLAIPA